MDLAEPRIDRRRALMGAGLVGAGALTALLPVSAIAADEEGTDLANPIEGAWLGDVKPDPASHQTPFRILNLYTRGGGVVGSSDQLPSTGSPGYGAWVRSGNHKFLITFELFVLVPAPGIFRVRAEATYDRQTDRISGPARFDFQPAGSPTFIPVGGSQFTAERVRALPL
jgi:hypothetical protein